MASFQQEFPLLCLLILFASSSHGQDKAPARTYFSNITVNDEGHICYAEQIGPHPLDRIEFLSEGKNILSLYRISGDVLSTVEGTDFNDDGRVDLLFFMHTSTGDDTTENVKIELYRGPVYVQHLRRHLGHALQSYRHTLIRDRPDIQEHTKAILAAIDRLDRRKVDNDECGVYSANYVFTPSGDMGFHALFDVSDTLTMAIRAVINGDVRMLSREPDIALRYKSEIRRLLAGDPVLLKPLR